MKIERNSTKLSSTWYTKSTDTGLTMNFHALAPKKYKRSVVIGVIHRIHRSCSSWSNVHESVEEAKTLLEKNRYPPSFYEPLISKTSKIVEMGNEAEKSGGANEEEERVAKKLIFLQYRGKLSEKFEKALINIKAPCRIVFTLKKLKCVLPPLKPSVEKCFKSGIVYQIKCPRCSACYVGQTSRHLQSRVREHKRNSPVAGHMRECNSVLTMDDVTILCTSTKSICNLMTLEALYIENIKPCLNTKDEYRNRSLVIKI